MPTGNFLAERMDVCQIYGTSEIGPVWLLIPEPEDWQWFDFNPIVTGGLRFDPIDGDPNVCELIVERNPAQEMFASVWFVYPHLRVYRTRDMFRKHPKRNLWSFEGRLDDVIVLNTGEKFNPVAAESLIQSHPLLSGALITGVKREKVTLLVETKDFRPDLVEKIWPIVEQANEKNGSHGRIDKNMIIVAGRDKPFRRAGKGTIVRSLTKQDYIGEIENLCA